MRVCVCVLRQRMGIMDCAIVSLREKAVKEYTAVYLHFHCCCVREFVCVCHNCYCLVPSQLRRRQRSADWQAWRRPRMCVAFTCRRRRRRCLRVSLCVCGVC